MGLKDRIEMTGRTGGWGGVIKKRVGKWLGRGGPAAVLDMAILVHVSCDSC